MGKMHPFMSPYETSWCNESQFITTWTHHNIVSFLRAVKLFRLVWLSTVDDRVVRVVYDGTAVCILHRAMLSTVDNSSAKPLASILS